VTARRVARAAVHTRESLHVLVQLRNEVSYTLRLVIFVVAVIFVTPLLDVLIVVVFAIALVLVSYGMFLGCQCSRTRRVPLVLSALSLIL
jgi:hypothetical protein